MSTRFDPELCRKAGVLWEDGAAETNAAMDQLAVGRFRELVVDDVLIKSKIAWKFATLRHSLTYRLVDLGEAAIGAWNDENFLSSIVLARAFLETAALLHSITHRMRKALDARDLGGLDDLAMQENFGARRADWVAENGLKATNVLTALDHMAADIDFVRDYYESISETAHPNAWGVGQFYATTDKKKIVVSYSRTKRDRAAVFNQINVALYLAAWSVRRLELYDQMIVAIADLQHELNPVGGKGNSPTRSAGG